MGEKTIKRINSIDILRMIAAFAVVIIHTPGINPYVNAVSRFAVPIFFMISGYFYCVSKEKKKLRIKKIFILTVIANLAFFIFYLFVALRNGTAINYLTETINLKDMVKFIFFNESLFSGHLWFLSALLYCMIIDYFLSDFLKKRKKLCLFVIIVLLLGDLIFGKYSLLLFNREFNVIYVRNFLFFGLPYFWLGKLFKNIDMKKLR